MESKQTKQPKWLLPAILVFTLVFLLCGWLLYDNLVDRSGWILEQNTYYYKDFHGRTVTGWQDLELGRYCFTEEGAMLQRWQEVDGNRYYFGDSGVMSTAWRDIQGSRYYFGTDGVMVTGWQEIDGSRYHFQETGQLCIGWLEAEEGRYYLGMDGAMVTGWVTLEEGTFFLGEDGITLTGHVTMEEERYFFAEDGAMYTGWLETEEGPWYYQEDGTMASGLCLIEEKYYRFNESNHPITGWYQEGEYFYYYHEDGAGAVGPTEIDGQTYFFTPKNIQVVLVNRQNPVPGYYELDLVKLVKWHQVASICLEPLQKMLEDCVAAGNEYTFNSGYRSIQEQRDILYTRTEEHMEEFFLSQEDAYAMALSSVAYPGTSEHHLGLAVDILGDDAVAWLGEHCWEYGFILRYTAEKESITGFIDEPWHFRYVGREVSMDMKDSGLCLEEYLGAA